MEGSRAGTPVLTGTSGRCWALPVPGSALSTRVPLPLWPCGQRGTDHQMAGRPGACLDV